jgi:hypothetical protein
MPSGTENSGSVAPGKVQPEKATPRGERARVRVLPQAHHLVEVETAFCGGAEDLEHHEVTRDPPPTSAVVGGGGCGVVGDDELTRRDPLGLEALPGEPEVHDVAGIVAVAEHHTAAAVRQATDRVGLRRRG